MRYTNFVEMTCPLFRRDKLDVFMKIYDPVLVGHGMDSWFLHTMGPDLRGHVAVVDEVTCVNPHDRSKGGREIDRLQSTKRRMEVWAEVRQKYGITSDGNRHVEYSRLAKSPLRAAAGVIWVFPMLVYFWSRRAAGHVRGFLREVLQTRSELGDSKRD